MEETIDLREFEEKLTSQDLADGLVKLPRELEGAPEDVIALYMRWLNLDHQVRTTPKRYFQWVSTKTGELVQVDAMAFQGAAVARAKEKGINPTDLARLVDVSKEMEFLKQQKSRTKARWMSYVRPRLGKNVYDWQRTSIIEMFGRYMSFDEVREELNKQGYHTNSTDIYKFFLNHRELIDKKRLEFIRSAKDHYLATDAGRMETLAMLHSRFMTMFNEAYGSPNANKQELRALSMEIRAILEQARKEIKGDEVRLTVDGKIDVNASIQASQTIQDISKKLPINIIPIYLVAVKQGINPNNILASLVGSFYKDFNGFNRLSTSGPVPSTMDLIRNYDWNEITRHHESKRLNQPVEEVPYEEMPFVEVQRVQSKREKLLELIRQQSATPSGNTQ